MNTIVQLPELRSTVFGLLSVNDVDALRITCKTYKKTLKVYYMHRALGALLQDNPHRFSQVTTHHYVKPTTAPRKMMGKHCNHHSFWQRNKCKTHPEQCDIHYEFLQMVKPLYKKRVPTCVQITTKGKQCTFKSNPKHYMVNDEGFHNSPYCTRHSKQNGYDKSSI